MLSHLYPIMYLEGLTTEDPSIQCRKNCPSLKEFHWRFANWMMPMSSLLPPKEDCWMGGFHCYHKVARWFSIIREGRSWWHPYSSRFKKRVVVVQVFIKECFLLFQCWFETWDAYSQVMFEGPISSDFSSQCSEVLTASSRWAVYSFHLPAQTDPESGHLKKPTCRTCRLQDYFFMRRMAWWRQLILVINELGQWFIYTWFSKIGRLSVIGSLAITGNHFGSKHQVSYRRCLRAITVPSAHS